MIKEYEDAMRRKRERGAIRTYQRKLMAKVLVPTTASVQAARPTVWVVQMSLVFCRFQLVPVELAKGGPR